MITPRVIRSEQDMRDLNLEFRERMRSLRYLPNRVSRDNAGSIGVEAFNSGGVEPVPAPGGP